MFNRGVYTVRIQKSYNRIAFYKQRIPIKTFLVEIKTKQKLPKKIRMKMRVAGKIGQDVISRCLPGQYCIIEGSLSVNVIRAQNKLDRNVLELNAYKIYPLAMLYTVSQ